MRAVSPAYQLWPSGPELAYQNARASAKEKKYAKAIAAYRKITADSPQSPLAADSLLKSPISRPFMTTLKKTMSWL